MSAQQSGLNGGATLQNESYLFDLLGNLTQRQNNNVGLTENFYYDDLYCLDHSMLNGAVNLPEQRRERAPLQRCGSTTHIAPFSQVTSYMDGFAAARIPATSHTPQ